MATCRNMPLLKKKLVEKMASVHDTKDTFVTMMETFVTEVNKYLSHDNSVIVEEFTVLALIFVRKPNLEKKTFIY